MPEGTPAPWRTPAPGRTLVPGGTTAPRRDTYSEGGTPAPGRTPAPGAGETPSRRNLHQEGHLCLGGHMCRVGHLRRGHSHERDAPRDPERPPYPPGPGPASPYAPPRKPETGRARMKHGDHRPGTRGPSGPAADSPSKPTPQPQPPPPESRKWTANGYFRFRQGRRKHGSGAPGGAGTRLLAERLQLGDLPRGRSPAGHGNCRVGVSLPVPAPPTQALSLPPATPACALPQGRRSLGSLRPAWLPAFSLRSLPDLRREDSPRAAVAPSSADASCLYVGLAVRTAVWQGRPTFAAD